MRRLLLPIILLILAVSLSLWFWFGRKGEVSTEGKQLGVSQVLGGAPAQGFARALAPRCFAFPADHGPHPSFRNEWWYFTGNLQGDQGRRFGYQLTFFRVALAPNPVKRGSTWGANEIYMADFAVTDVRGKKFHFAERFSREALGLAGAGGDPLSIWLEDWSARELSPRPWSMKLNAAAPEMAVDLELTSLTPEILNGDAGLSRKSGTPGNASFYYSIPRMETSGTVRLGAESFRVTGTSWLDREWSTSALEADQVGWDWFALQLDDGRDLMFYRLRRRDGTTDPYSAGTLVAADGRSLSLGRDNVRLQVSRWWTSPKSGARYPSVWRLTIPSQGIELVVSPRLEDQELITSFRYWEGAVAVRRPDGRPAGSGYLEMTGY